MTPSLNHEDPIHLLAVEITVDLVVEEQESAERPMIAVRAFRVVRDQGQEWDLVDHAGTEVRQWNRGCDERINIWS